MRFGGGLVLGLILGAAGLFGYQRVASHEDPCLGHCGTGTTCVEGVCLLEEKKVARKKRRKRRRWRRRRPRAKGADEETWRTPTAKDLKSVAKGPSLKQTDYINMEDKGGDERELTSAEVDGRFRRLDRRIIACIDRAREGWDISTGKVVVSFRIERKGSVSKVRVSAPAVLQRQGLYDCVRPLVTALRFPPSGRALVMSYPYRLD
jgi:hypothetical protein